MTRVGLVKSERTRVAVLLRVYVDVPRGRRDVVESAAWHHGYALIQRADLDGGVVRCEVVPADQGRRRP